MFDFAVNAGISTAIKKLQLLAGVKPDGIMGNLTIAASKRVSPWDDAGERIEHYVAIVRARPKDLVFLNGWMLRNLEFTRISISHV